MGEYAVNQMIADAKDLFGVDFDIEDFDNTKSKIKKKMNKRSKPKGLKVVEFKIVEGK